MLAKFHKARLMWSYDRCVVYEKLGLSRFTASSRRQLTDWRVDRYWLSSGLEALFRRESVVASDYALSVPAHKKADVTYLHQHVGDYKTVVELGCGVSTIAMAHGVRRKNGRVYAVEADERWADIVRGKLESLGLAGLAEITVSTPVLTEYNGQVCHVFERLPDVRPEFMYIDGPAPDAVRGSVHGLTMKGLTFANAADPLFYEYSFYAGFKMVVDGRTNNVYFLQNNLRRQYHVKRDYFSNRTTFELVR